MEISKTKRFLSRPALEEQRSVGTAEAERIAERIFHGGFASMVGHVVEVALGILVVEVDGGREALIAQRQHSDAGFESAGAAEQVPGHGLGRADSNFLDVFSEEILDGMRLEDIADRRRSPVCVHVADL